MPLLEDTQQLLKATLKRSNLTAIHEASEGTVAYEWLKKFSAGEVAHPSIVRVQALHDCLKKLKFKAAA